MKNPELKNIFIAAGIAVFAGVLVLGVNAAFGVSAPIVEPPGGDIGPTFSEVTTTGNIDTGGNLAVTGTSDFRGNVSNSTGDITIDDNVGITSGKTVINQGSLEVWNYAGFPGGIIMDMYETWDSNLTGVNDIQVHGEISHPNIDEDVTVADGMDIWGSIKNTNTDPSKPGSDFSVAIDDKFQVSGLTTFGNNVNVIGDLSVIDGNMAVGSGTLDVSGAITANRFGTYNVSTTLYTMQPADPIGWKYLSKACPTGQILVSCGGGRDWGSLEFGELYPGNNDNTCYLEIHKRNVGYYAYAHISTICLDPDA